MAADVNVKSIQMLGAYQKSFNNYSTAAQHKINSYLALLENSENKARGVKQRIHSFAERRKSYLYNAKAKLASTCTANPVVPSRVANATKAVEGCKKAYDKAREYEEQCDKMYKKLILDIDRAKQESIKHRSELNNSASGGNQFLNSYIQKLKEYSGHNG